ncbi:hypothetical protein [Paraburkholderia sp.]|jgi:predicted Rossmann fold nucleotide-binding protein DprA/Smf involved in DNA uptake|uniref:hypothetical protein n=1 Tax=Paraburkholderia sp. TaxID=1926495 RepID=UPI002F3E815E
MKTSFSAATAALSLAASLFCVAAYADQPLANPPATQAVQSQPAVGSADQTAQSQGLTRQQVYDQLVQAEKDGSLARLNSTIYAGS